MGRRIPIDSSYEVGLGIPLSALNAQLQDL